MTCPFCGSSSVVTVAAGRGLGCQHCLKVWLPPPGPPSPEPSREIAKVQGKVLGFRAWSLNGGLLGSVAQSGGWTVGVNTARCVAGAPHLAPAHGCQCGLYAMHEPPGYAMDYVYGAVLAWGRIEVHVQGFRAQYAEPVMLAYSDGQPYGLVVRVQALASEMGIECVQLADLTERAQEVGKPIAPELRPAWLTPPRKPYVGGYAGASVGMAPVATGMAYPSPHLILPPAPRRRPP